MHAIEKTANGAGFSITRVLTIHPSVTLCYCVQIKAPIVKRCHYARISFYSFLLAQPALEI